jgi:hypothetical protein
MVLRTLKLLLTLPSYNKLSTISTRNLLVFLSEPFQDERKAVTTTRLVYCGIQGLTIS